MSEQVNDNLRTRVRERHKTIRFTVGCICGLLAIALVCYTIIKVTATPPWIQFAAVVAGIPASVLTILALYRKWHISIGKKFKIEVDGYLTQEMTRDEIATEENSDE